MNLNFDFYTEEQEEKITEQEKIQIEKYFSEFGENEIRKENMSLEEFKVVSQIGGNLVNWYEFKENAEILDLHPNFGERLGQLLKTAKNVTAISPSKEKAIALSKRYSQASNLSIFTGYFENVVLEQKFDYILIMGMNSIEELTKKMAYAKAHLKQDGKILLAFDNKFGMKYWTGIQEEIPNPYDTIVGKTDKLTLGEVERVLEKEAFHYKIYYPLPDYRFTNAIFSEDYLPDAESIMSRDLICFDDEEYCEFSQRLAYIELLKENKNYFKVFANSYFVEVANQPIDNEIKYANFEIYRKPKYDIKTIIKEDFVYKRANHEMAQAHIDRIKKNIQILNENHIQTLDSYDETQIISRYAKNGIPLEKYILEAYHQKGKTAIFDLLNQFKIQILDKFPYIEKPAKTVFDQYGIDASQWKNLHYVKDGLIDLRAQNCFVIDDEFYIYDQEWYEENVPIEFILYRFLHYNEEINRYISEQEMYEKYGLTDYLEIFKELDAAIFETIRDHYMMLAHTRSLDRIGRKTKELMNLQQRIEAETQNSANLQKIIEDLKCGIKNYEENIRLSNNHIENLETNINSYKEVLGQKEQEIQTKEQEIKDKEIEIKEKQKKITEFEIGIQNYRQGIQDLTNLIHEKDAELENYANQLRTISHSLSWKITKPIRILSWVLNPFSGASLIDRIMPPGGRRRIEYDQKQTQKKYAQKVANYFRLTDEETAEYWKGIDHRKALKQQKDLEKQAEDELEDYEKWVLANTPTEQELEKQSKTRFKKKPKISIVIPLYKTNPEFFRELLYSVHCQTYSNWELCLADGSPEPLVEIQKMCEKDKRIKYQFLGKNEGISENTNVAIQMATGEYVGLLDHDDMLSLDALYEVVKVINQDKKVEFIYSDEDKFQTLDESRYMPHFKPDFAPDTLRANNYICHFSVIKKTLLDKVGYFNHEFDGAQDFDLILRVTEQAQKIVHIAKVLYHWRVHKESTAMSAEAKPYAFIAGRKAVEAHLQRVGLSGKVKDGYTLGTYTIDYDVIGNPKVTILIPNKDGIDMLDICLKSILEKTTYANYEIVIIENNSEKSETFEYYKKLESNEKVKMITYPEKGFNYSRIINFGVKNTQGDFVVQLNNDTKVLTPDWLEKMLGFAQRQDVGAVGVRLYYSDETIQHAGIMVGVLMVAAHIFRNWPKDNLGYFGRERLIQNMNAVTAACLMTKREIYEQVNFMNEEFAVAFNDVDFCLRIRKLGQLIVYNPYVEFVHYESKTRGNDNDPDKVERFQGEINLFLDTWKEKLAQGDEYYNKNFRLDDDQYAVKTEKVEE